MFSRIVLGHNHKRSTGNDSTGLHPCSATHPLRRVYKTDCCVTFMCSTNYWWPAVLQKSRKLQTRIMIEPYYSFFHYCLQGWQNGTIRKHGIRYASIFAKKYSTLVRYAFFCNGTGAVRWCAV